jgi:hypothetical protein
MSFLLQLERDSEKIGKDIWCSSDLVSDGLLQRWSQLQVQFKVQNALQKTAKLLRNHADDKKKSLPNQLANRMKTFIKFVFGETNRGGKQEKQQTQFRKLPCDALKFCGLSYTIKEVLELPTAQFDFLIANVADFINRQNLSHYLYRADINNVIINSDFDTNHKDLFEAFVNCRFASGGIAEN